MRSSAHSTRLRGSGGFTLVEVAIAATLFAIVMAVVLQQLSDTANLSKVALARADLRRIGEHILADIANDVRTSQTLYSSAQQGDGSTNASTGLVALEMYKIIGWDSTAQSPRLDNTNGTAGGGTLKLTRYAQPTTAANTYNGNLEFFHNTFTAGSGPSLTPTAILTTELFPSQGSTDGVTYPPRGFVITLESGGTFPGLISVSATNVFSGASDKPHSLALTLNLRRNVGFKGTNSPTTLSPGQIDTSTILEAVVKVTTTVELRPSSAY